MENVQQSQVEQKMPIPDLEDDDLPVPHLLKHSHLHLLAKAIHPVDLVLPQHLNPLLALLLLLTHPLCEYLPDVLNSASLVRHHGEILVNGLIVEVLLV